MKKTITVLSVDYDYFIDVNENRRQLMFPQGADELTPEELKERWGECYNKYPRLKRVLTHLTKLYQFSHYLYNQPEIDKDRVMTTTSHKYAKDFIDKNVPKDADLVIYNIDHHHDYYHYHTKDNPCNCSNWLRLVLEERPNTKVVWICNNSSDTKTLEGEVPFEVTRSLGDLPESFDLLFMCSSPEWTPPHLLEHFDQLCANIHLID